MIQLSIKRGKRCCLAHQVRSIFILHCTYLYSDSLPIVDTGQRLQNVKQTKYDLHMIHDI